MIFKNSEDYLLAQGAIADLKAALLSAVNKNPGLSIAQLGRMLGIDSGHLGHEGQIPRTLLGIMEKDRFFGQNEADKTWPPKDHAAK